jgi:uncharacterized protein
MALLEKQLFVKKSTIPNSGKGLFTKKPITKGTRIVEYKGIISTWKDVADEDGKNGYIFYVTRKHVINALPVKTALARYANDAKGLTRVKGLNNNCDYISDGLHAYIESKKDIPAGAEIFVDYGKDYWKVIRQNIKLREKEARDELKKLNGAKKVNGAKAVNGARKVNGKAVNGVKKLNGAKSTRTTTTVKKKIKRLARA